MSTFQLVLQAGVHNVAQPLKVWSGPFSLAKYVLLYRTDFKRVENAGGPSPFRNNKYVYITMQVAE